MFGIANARSCQSARFFLCVALFGEGNAVKNRIVEAVGSVTTFYGYGFFLVVKQKSGQSKGLSFRLFSSSEIVNLLPFGFVVKTGAFLHDNDY